MPIIYSARLKVLEALLNAIRVEHDVAVERGVLDRAKMDEQFAGLLLEEFATAADVAINAFEISGRNATPELRKLHEVLLEEIKLGQSKAQKLEFL
jgi:hypothetical protein